MEIQDFLLGTISDPQCRSQIVKTWKGAMNLDVWALRMLDATAKIPVGLLTGNLNHFGNMDECIDVTANEDSETFYGKHCLVHFPITAISNRIPGAASLIQYKWGVCIPSSCSAEDLKNFLRYTLHLPAQVQEFDCHTLHEEKPYRIHEIVTLAVIALLLLLVLLSSIYDLFGKPGDKNELLTSFSLITNVKNLVNPETPPGSIDALHGLRFFATSMVVLGHVYMTKGLVGNDINRIRYLEWLSDWEHVWLTSRGILVDAFFVLGGLLAAYVFLKDRGEGKTFNLINFYLHRYLRMAPPMAIVLLFEATLTNRIGSGPDWENCSRRQEKSCQMNWWKHILFIQNWWGIQKCMQHTWYICVDMQLYFLAPVLLIPLHRWPRIGMVLTYSAIVLAFLVSFGLSYGYQEKVDLLRNGGDDLERKLYHATYHRITPWLIGIILGYYLYQFRHLKDSFRKTNRKNRSIAEKCLKFVIAIVLWCVCFSLALATWITVHPFIQPDYVYNAFWSATYLATSHIVASLFTVMAVVLILTGYGGPIDMLFSWKACVPLSRLTYSIFLIHLMIVKVRLKDVRTTDFLSDVELLMCWLSVMVFSVSFSIILFLMVEQPFSIIERYILNKGISQTGIRNISNDGKKRSATNSESCDKDVEKSGSGITEKNFNGTVHRTWKLFTVFH